MKTLTNSTAGIPIEFPRTWDPTALTAVGVQIRDLEGTALLDPAGTATLYAESELESDARRYVRRVTLASGAEDLKTGDLIRVSGIGGYEDHTVKGWDSENRTAELENHVDRDFEAGSTVNRLSAVYASDLSDTDVFAPGSRLVITWTPVGTGSALTEMVEVETCRQLDPVAFTSEFQALYPRAYNALKNPADRFDTVIRLAQNELRSTLASRHLDIARLVDHRLIAPSLMALVACMWARGGDEQTADEHAVLSKAYSAALERLCQQPVWVDADGDGTQDDGEVEDHPVGFGRIW